MKIPSRFTVLVHKYGLYYSGILFILFLIYSGKYPNSLDFWCFLFIFGLHTYFVFVRGMAQGVGMALRQIVVKAVTIEAEKQEKTTD